MEKMKPRFDVQMLPEADEFLASLDVKARNKIIYNVRKSTFVIDNELFKKLEGSDIWEFRTLYGGICYRLLAFWDKEANSLVLATHGFEKKTDKTPKKEIERAETIRKQYFNDKKNNK
jgi:phage-related protein